MALPLPTVGPTPDSLSREGHAVNIGETGMIQIIDLANVWSSMSVLTEDLAIEHGRSFQCGRTGHNGAELRGCSLSTDHFT